MKNNTSKNLIKDQQEFFNLDSQKEKTLNKNSIFYIYANKEQLTGFEWIENKHTLLDYGCGTGTSMDRFFEVGRKKEDYIFYGVDIAENAIKKAREKYPEYSFYKIADNKITQLKNNSVDGAYLYHVLHHSHDHLSIFNEIHSKLQADGKFLINDLSSRNPIIRLGRKVFVYISPLIEKYFSDDLVVEGKIPEKYPVSIEETTQMLNKAGFKIVNIYYGHLFFFIFGWIDRFIPLSKIRPFAWLYRKIMSLEEYLLKKKFFKQYAELFCVYCTKK